MCSKEHHLEFFWPYLLTAEPIKRSLLNKSCKDDIGIWSHDVNKCLLSAYCTAKEEQAELKILNLLMYSPRETGGIEAVSFRQREPTDAEIVFGNCSCKKLFCNRRSFETGWDKSRIDWLWDLEHLEPQNHLHYIWREYGMCKPFSKRSTVSTVINLERPAESQPKKISCWSWLRHSCGYVSDTESWDVVKSAISL